LAARLQTRVKRNAKWSSEVIYLVSSFTLEEIQARGMLGVKRGYWVVESRLHIAWILRCGKIRAECAPQEQRGFWARFDAWW